MRLTPSAQAYWRRLRDEAERALAEDPDPDAKADVPTLALEQLQRALADRDISRRPNARENSPSA